jgi:hypothetical protein
MKCPTCLQHTTPDSWTLYETQEPPIHEEQAKMLAYGQKAINAGERPVYTEDGTLYWFDWMRCANKDCKQLVIRMHGTKPIAPGGPLSHVYAARPADAYSESWIVLPRFGSAARPVDPLVPARLRDDLSEAAAILDLSPRMSAVLTRSILADVLAQYAGHEEFKLADRIDSFNKDTAHPRALRENLHRFREVANLGAHTTTSDQGEVIEIEREEAEWTIDLVERLFDYLIVTPAGDKKMRDAIDEKVKAASRKPIKPLPDDPPDAKRR